LTFTYTVFEVFQTARLQYKFILISQI